MRIFLMAVTVFLALAPPVLADEVEINDAGIFECHGVTECSGSLTMCFEVFINDGKKLKKVHVNPSGLTVEVRRDNKEITTLTVNGKVGALDSVMSAKLLVPDIQDLKTWKDFLVKVKNDLRADGELVAVELKFIKDEGGVVFIETNIRNSERTKSQIGWEKYVTAIRVSPEKIGVRWDKEATNEKPQVVVEWGLNQVKRDLGSMTEPNSSYINAPELTIVVKTEAESKEWNTKVLKWCEKIRPHRVLPSNHD